MHNSPFFTVLLQSQSSAFKPLLLASPRYHYTISLIRLSPTNSPIHRLKYTFTDSVTLPHIAAMKTTSIATLVALLSSSSSASTVTLETTACLDPSIPLQRLSIAMNLSGPVARGTSPHLTPIPTHH
jgi:hypothetical protein